MGEVVIVLMEVPAARVGDRARRRSRILRCPCRQGLGSAVLDFAEEELRLIVMVPGLWLGLGLSLP